MKFAFRAELIDKNPIDLVDNLTVSKPKIYPMSIEKVHRFLDVVNPQYKNFFIVAFYSGVRFGEMAALKWKNIDFKLDVIKVRETRVRGEEGRPKTAGSIRDIKILPPTNVYKPSVKKTDKTSDKDEKSENFTPNLHQEEKRKLA